VRVNYEKRCNILDRKRKQYIRYSNVNNINISFIYYFILLKTKLWQGLD